jgi:uncharacterized protein YabN with tetrapyrrole methylase and pyrophosphatase domain
MDIRELQKELFIDYKEKGYYKSWNVENQLDASSQKKFDIAELGLIITEVSEAIEEIRKQNNKFTREHLAEECADIIIRTINFMSRKGLDLEIALWLKNNKNKNREWLHEKDV